MQRLSDTGRADPDFHVILKVSSLEMKMATTKKALKIQDMGAKMPLVFYIY